LRQNRLGGLTSRGGPEKKVRKSREAPIGMMCRREHRACATAQPVMHPLCYMYVMLCRLHNPTVKINSNGKSKPMQTKFEVTSSNSF